MKISPAKTVENLSVRIWSLLAFAVLCTAVASVFAQESTESEAGPTSVNRLTASEGTVLPDPKAADDTVPDTTVSEEAVPEAKKKKYEPAPKLDRTGLRKLAKDADVWIDAKKKQVVIDGEVCLVKGQLEMFACPSGTKEHESVVSVRTKAYYVHAALLALGAKPGTTVKFDPKYKPATGTEVGVEVYWVDDKGVPHQTAAQNWIRNVKNGKPMDYTWVFAGSKFDTDETTGIRTYLAEFGDFICVSNFSSAMMDLPVASSQDTEDLLYEAFTENIPPRRTKVSLILTPKLEVKDVKKVDGKKVDSKQADGKKTAEPVKVEPEKK
ncbi:MAG: YdjY domain-containing protein [Planctomycetota bacterium]|nr:YdjY domain-containing protein [Planctomycetota bacterium]